LPAFVGPVARGRSKKRVSRDSVVVAQTLSRRLPYAVHMHTVLTSDFVRFVN
jgi:hypothetical protein